jgi:uncharacterized protein
MPKGPWVFDSDTHITEEADTWDSVKAAFRKNGLRIATDRERWRCLMLGRSKLTRIVAPAEGEFDRMRELVREDPLAFETYAEERFAVPPPGPPAPRLENDVMARLSTMDEMGVSHAVMYPSFGLFWPHLVGDAELADAHYSAFNDWIAARTAAVRHRILPIAQYSFASTRRAVAEIRRCRKLGLRGLMVQTIPYRELPWDHKSYEPIWKALDAEDLPLVLHFTVLQSKLVHEAWEKRKANGHVGPPVHFVINRPAAAEAALTSLIFGGVLERHPRLRIGVIEFGGSWVPSFLHRLDFAMDFISPRNRYLRERLPLRPSEYFKRQVKVSAFWNEPLAWLIRSAGDGVFLFGSDYPHPEGNVRAVELSKQNLVGVSQKSQRRFFRDNGRELFGERV